MRATKLNEKLTKNLLSHLKKKILWICNKTAAV